MAGLYSDIAIVAPSSARAGETVSVEVRVKNLVDYTIYVIPVIDVDGGRDEGSYRTIVPGQTLSWYFSFTMPSRSVTVTAESWCEDTFDWHLDDTAQQNIALEVVAPPVAGTITRKELDYQNIWQVLPISDIPVDTRTRVRITGRNDTSINQKMGIYWFVADPEGYVAQEYENWEAFWTGPGLEQEFIGSGFDLSKVGKYTIWVELLMNPENPQVVDQYIGDLCTVEAVPEVFAGRITKKELDYDAVRVPFPVQ